MLPLRLKYEPVFDINRDLDLLGAALQGDNETDIDPKVAFFPTSRAYIVTSDLEPVAIFDRPGAAVGGFIKLAITMTPDHIDNPMGLNDLKVMNALRNAVNSEDFKRPYRLAVFVADRLFLHVPISPDLMLVLCERLGELDIVDRGLWEFVFDAGAE